MVVISLRLFSLFLSIHSVFKRDHKEMQLHLSAIAPYIEYIKIRGGIIANVLSQKNNIDYILMRYLWVVR